MKKQEIYDEVEALIQSIIGVNNFEFGLTAILNPIILASNDPDKILIWKFNKRNEKVALQVYNDISLQYGINQYKSKVIPPKLPGLYLYIKIKY